MERDLVPEEFYLVSLVSMLFNSHILFEKPLKCSKKVTFDSNNLHFLNIYVWYNYAQEYHENGPS